MGRARPPGLAPSASARVRSRARQWGGWLLVLAGAALLAPAPVPASPPLGSPGAAGEDRARSARPPERRAPPRVVCIDEGHHEMHRLGGTYALFAEWLRADGFTVEAYEGPFEREALERCGVLVVANALHRRNRIRGEQTDWSLPAPSAFTVEEIEAVRAWVEAGGGLLLIADHMPFPGAARDLAAAFGVRFSNGFALDTAARRQELGPYRGRTRFVFRRRDGRLVSHPITDGWEGAPRVDSVVTYTGQAFQARGGVDPVLVVPATTISVLPQSAWEFGEATPVVDAGRWLQGAATRAGQGRVVVLGEAAQFRPAEGGGARGGNDVFARNVVRWLAGSGPR